MGRLALMTASSRQDARIAEGARQGASRARAAISSAAGNLGGRGETHLFGDRTMRGAIVIALWGGAGILLACGQPSGGTDPFGVPGGGPSPVTAGPSEDDEDDDGESSGGASSSGDDEGGSTAGADPGAEDTSAPASTGGFDESTDGGAATDGGGPPMMTGMYGECLVPQECAAQTNVCIVVNDTEGFCTNMACTNPATDCEPSPGGTATPICFPIELGGMPTASCALGCAGALTCPAGMMCWPLAEGSICA